MSTLCRKISYDNWKRYAVEPFLLSVNWNSHLHLLRVAWASSKDNPKLNKKLIDVELHESGKDENLRLILDLRQLILGILT